MAFIHPHCLYNSVDFSSETLIEITHNEAKLGYLVFCEPKDFTNIFDTLKNKTPSIQNRMSYILIGNSSYLTMRDTLAKKEPLLWTGQSRNALSRMISHTYFQKNKKINMLPKKEFWQHHWAFLCCFIATNATSHNSLDLVENALLSTVEHLPKTNSLNMNKSRIGKDKLSYDKDSLIHASAIFHGIISVLKNSPCFNTHQKNYLTKHESEKLKDFYKNLQHSSHNENSLKDKKLTSFQEKLITIEETLSMMGVKNPLVEDLKKYLFMKSTEQETLDYLDNRISYKQYISLLEEKKESFPHTEENSTTLKETLFAKTKKPVSSQETISS